MIREMTVDVNIDTFDVLCQLSEDWRVSIGVCRDSPIMGGYWMSTTYIDGDEEAIKYERIRLATHPEIIRMDAFKNITEYTARLF